MTERWLQWWSITITVFNVHCGWWQRWEMCPGTHPHPQPLSHRQMRNHFCECLVSHAWMPQRPSRDNAKMAALHICTAEPSVKRSHSAWVFEDEVERGQEAQGGVSHSHSTWITTDPRAETGCGIFLHNCDLWPASRQRHRISASPTKKAEVKLSERRRN